MDETIKNMIDDKKNYDKEGKFYLDMNKSDLRVVIYSSECVENRYIISVIYTGPCLTTFVPHFHDIGTLEHVLTLGYKLFNQ